MGAFVGTDQFGDLSFYGLQIRSVGTPVVGNPRDGQWHCGILFSVSHEESIQQKPSEIETPRASAGLAGEGV